MKIQINRLTLPADRRILVTSDIHGQLGHLKGALETANFSKDDILFIIGDMIEKGPNSLGVLRYVMELCETHTVYPLIGNVDAHRLGDDRPVAYRGDLSLPQTYAAPLGRLPALGNVRRARHPHPLPARPVGGAHQNTGRFSKGA